MLKNRLMAIINLNEDNIATQELIKDRPLACLPLFGRYRVIDFILSNISNANISNVGVFSQRKTRSLYDHLGDGEPWDLDRIKDGLFIFSQQYEIHEKQMSGDIYTIFENLDYIENSSQEYILIATPYMIFNINFNKIFEEHLNSSAYITALYKSIDNADRDFFRSVTYNIEDDKIRSIGKNIGSTKKQNISLDCFIMKKSDFINLIYTNIEMGKNVYIEDAINDKLYSEKVNLHEIKSYVKCINSIRSYLDFSQDMLNPDISNELLKNPDNLIYTKIKDEAPTYFSDDSLVENSIVSSGCVIHGNVKNSVISRRVIIGEGSVIENCILMQNTVVEKNTYLKHLISDKNSRITSGKKLIGDFNMPIIVNKGETI